MKHLVLEAKTFTFDHSYWVDTAQTAVFADLGKPIVDKAVEGFNGTVFAYGQTGSGKVHGCALRLCIAYGSLSESAM